MFKQAGSPVVRPERRADLEEIDLNLARIQFVWLLLYPTKRPDKGDQTYHTLHKRSQPRKIPCPPFLVYP